MTLTLPAPLTRLYNFDLKSPSVNCLPSPMNDSLLSSDAYLALVEQIYAVIRGEQGLLDGCSKLWRLADQLGVLFELHMEWFIELELKLDQALAGIDQTTRLAIRQEFEGEVFRDASAKLEALLLELEEPFYSLSFYARACLEAPEPNLADLFALRAAILELDLGEVEPFKIIVRELSEIEDLPHDSDAHLWHPQLLKKKQDANREILRKAEKELQRCCLEILANAPCF
ncbi:MAG: hypothetical protein SFV17_26815 [Candidatus Obscuribacter sp.]|nr:hypothetical protein [Candidatus Obscuribacter sp.]